MSSAHRPTWDPAAGKSDNRHNSRLYSVRQMPAHTKLKFRAPSQQALPDGLNVRDIQSGADVAGRRDLKRELERAERTARNKRRKEQGLEEEPEPEEPEEQGEKDQRRLAIQEAAAAQLDKDDDSSDEEGAKSKGKARAVDADEDAPAAGAGADASDSSDSDSDSDDEEDDTAALLRELEKIKRERAEEKARNEAERSAAEQSQREDDIALGNPLLNLENAMKGGPGAASAASKQKLDFGVKRRWDDDVIFKNQAAGNEGSGEKGFVNDLTRSEFHKKFLNRYIR